jgi:glycosyltransferase involved in cell wall biosynthesis
MELVSIVIPVYNTGAFLTRCINSVKNQTYKNLEILLVDDGSTDNSGILCDSLAGEDPRIQVFHKANGGLSDARNAGVLLSKGSYITFIDSDDWVDVDYIAYLLSLITETNSDCSVCGFKKVSSTNRIHATKERRRRIFTGLEALENMLYQIDFDTNAWGKLFRRDIVLNNPYPVGKCYEDLFTTYKMVYRKRIIYGDRQLYFYFQRTGSIMNSRFSFSQLDQIDAVEEIENYVSERCPELLSAAQSRKFSSYCQVLLRMPPEKNKYIEEKRILWEYIKYKRWDVLKDTKTRIKNKICAIISFGGITIMRLIYQIIN